jgi:mono/diheme cytochrome c family protein
MRRELMKDHFDQASQARDAVVRGQLALAEAPLTWLGQHGFAKDLPADWRPHIDRMQQAAVEATKLSTLAAAAAGVSAMASECGACHQALSRGPELEPTGLESDDSTKPLSAQAALQHRMDEQLWGIERMWEGLVIPSDHAWREGAKSLGELKAHPLVAAKLRARLERVRSLGVEASAASNAELRARSYARILAECGSCHAESGVDPGATPEPEQPSEP